MKTHLIAAALALTVSAPAMAEGPVMTTVSGAFDDVQFDIVRDRLHYFEPEGTRITS